MKQFEEIKFDIEELKGISSKNIQEHLKLYAGYVKNTNMLLWSEVLSNDLILKSLCLGTVLLDAQPEFSKAGQINNSIIIVKACNVLCDAVLASVFMRISFLGNGDS